jgi:hypothetical protein
MTRLGNWPAIARAALAVSALLLAVVEGRAQIRVTGGGSTVGYIDGAPLEDQIRIRIDGAYNNRRPRRAEFFWAKAPPPTGPARAESSVDYQEAQLYVEKVLTDGLSAFVETGFRLLNPDVNDNTGGLADMNFGVKCALYDCEDFLLTFQFRTYLPTGDADRGLGTDHVSLEPALLFYMPWDDRWTIEGEFKWWIPIDGTEFAGDILRYGVGVSYAVYDDCCLSVRPVVEVVGWTVLDGMATAVSQKDIVTLEDSAGDTIVNAKLGVRVWCGSSDFYAGYGRPLTGDRWYENTWRLEWRLRF